MLRNINAVCMCGWHTDESKPKPAAIDFTYLLFITSTKVLCNWNVSSKLTHISHNGWLKPNKIMKLLNFYVVDAVTVQLWTGSHLGIVFNIVMPMH